MRSSKAEGAAGVAALPFDPDAVLFQDPGLLLDPGFLAGLHREAHRDDDGEPDAGEDDAARTLLQMGFLMGLQDALRAISDAFSGDTPAGQPVVAPPLPIRFTKAPTSLEYDAGVTLTGEWPERTEATAHLETLGRPAHPACWLSAGYTSGWLSGTFEADILALETACGACGDETCHFEAMEIDAWRERPEAAAWLDALPFAQLRAFVTSRIDRDLEAPMEAAGFDPEPGAVHIWGPLMIIPFLGGDEALAAIELIGRDPAARDVSVVAIDLTGVVLDETFGAIALEQILDTIEAWGAETVLAGVSELSRRIVDDLERSPLFVYKDLAEAIAAAFRIAASQRRPV